MRKLIAILVFSVIGCSVTMVKMSRVNTGGDIEVNAFGEADSTMVDVSPRMGASLNVKNDTVK